MNMPISPLAVMQNLPKAHGKARQKHGRVATRLRGSRLLVNRHELWDSLFITASQVGAMFMCADEWRAKKII